MYLVKRILGLDREWSWSLYGKRVKKERKTKDTKKRENSWPKHQKS